MSDASPELVIAIVMIALGVLCLIAANGGGDDE